MIILGISAEHNSSACLMVNGKIKGLIQEERLTKIKNQCAFPLLSIKSLVKLHLNNNYEAIDEVVYGTNISDPYYSCLDRYSNVTIQDHINEMYKVWYPHYYKGKKNNGEYWKKQYLTKKNRNKFHNYDFTFLNENTTFEEKLDYFSKVERKNVIKRNFPKIKRISSIDHHTCHAYYSAYGGNLSNSKLRDSLILTADAWGDYKNWSVSVVENNGRLKRLSSGNNFTVARIYKFCTLILGMKPNEHEYKVMGLSSYSKSNKHIQSVEKIFYDILDFRKGKFLSRKPLIDSYFDLKERLEGHRFDNISAAMQNWSSSVTCKWADYWLEKTAMKGIAFSGGLSMNIKANGDLLKLDRVKWLSVPASGGDESLSVGACYAKALSKKQKVFNLITPYLGEKSYLDDSWDSRLNDTGLNKKDFEIAKNFSNKKVATLLSRNEIVARCVGNAEFGARALGNRSILAHPSYFENIEIINNLIKNRDFWMPFTPSILEEKANTYLINKKNVISPYMTIGYQTTVQAKNKIPACLHMGDKSARPQFVKKNINTEYWDLINNFYKITKVPCLLNTSLNLHGEPMNYTTADAVRTLALSSLNFLIVSGEVLIFKRKSKKKIIDLLG